MAVLAVLLTVSVACASGTLGIYENPSTGDVCFDVYMNRSYSSHVGAFGYLSVSDSWSEAYAGPAYSFNSHCGIELGAGVERDQKSVRWGGDVWACQGKTAVTYLFEAGGSGAWHKLKILRSINPRITVGVIEKSGPGWAATASYKLDGCTALGWTAYQNGTSQLSLCIGF
jgi:hypothetical protein